MCSYLLMANAMAYLRVAGTAWHDASRSAGPRMVEQKEDGLVQGAVKYRTGALLTSLTICLSVAHTPLTYERSHRAR
jgi:hypothetical protein